MAELPTCGGGLGAGWIIFAETGIPNLVVDEGEAVLRRFPAIENDIVIHTESDDDYFTFAATGLGHSQIGGTAPLATMVLCDPRGNVTGGGGKSTARVVIVTPLGRAMVLADIDQVADHDDDDKCVPR
jgi:hypothetical protein